MFHGIIFYYITISIIRVILYVLGKIYFMTEAIRRLITFQTNVNSFPPVLKGNKFKYESFQLRVFATKQSIFSK